MPDRDQSPMMFKYSGVGLLLSIMISLFVLPFFEGMRAGRTMFVLGYSLLLVLAAISTRTNFRLIAVSLLIVAIPAGVGSLLIEWKALLVVFCLVGSTVFWYAGIKIVLDVVRSRSIEFDSILRAVTSYLLFGLGWSLTYWAMCIIDPQSFLAPNLDSELNGRENDVQFSTLIYYSFVTMSTLGYGDIIPNGRVTRTLAWMQSVTGQFYVAVAIAWLVSSLPKAQDMNGHDPQESDREANEVDNA
ncbi:MAG: ion channel [Planctomycetota bacterium]